MNIEQQYTCFNSEQHQPDLLDFIVIVLILASVAYSVFKLCIYVTLKPNYQPIIDIESQKWPKYVKGPKKTDIWYTCHILDKILKCYDIIRNLSLILTHKMPSINHDEL